MEKSCDNFKRLYTTPGQADKAIRKKQYKMKTRSPCSKTTNFMRVTVNIKH